MARKGMSSERTRRLKPPTLTKPRYRRSSAHVAIAQHESTPTSTAIVYATLPAVALISAVGNPTTIAMARAINATLGNG